jgi:hypothetical protein
LAADDEMIDDQMSLMRWKEYAHELVRVAVQQYQRWYVLLFRAKSKSSPQVIFPRPTVNVFVCFHCAALPISQLRLHTPRRKRTPSTLPDSFHNRINTLQNPKPSLITRQPPYSIFCFLRQVQTLPMHAKVTVHKSLLPAFVFQGLS